jgi:phage portal protein BeeE
MVQDLKRATFGNIEHQSIDFVVHTLDPWLTRIEQAIIKDVLLEDE